LTIYKIYWYFPCASRAGEAELNALRLVVWIGQSFTIGYIYRLAFSERTEDITKRRFAVTILSKNES
jgi:hypothetical protein